ncbi:hypothetical protein PDE_03950 [Penicillium oxalicum 114-2]|uniref:Uncharacterized protein n=1 Tax=Penicillium oxalicum (strain 114-2 / CGMCC 5302) TaxID=933388 RepID=S7ZFD7_PENO1|nr:hypothetical protein PDE_03950 [Penicillium oxalicum 114-2]
MEFSLGVAVCTWVGIPQCDTARLSTLTDSHRVRHTMILFEYLSFWRLDIMWSLCINDLGFSPWNTWPYNAHGGGLLACSAHRDTRFYVTKDNAGEMRRERVSVLERSAYRVLTPQCYRACYRQGIGEKRALHKGSTTSNSTQCTPTLGPPPVLCHLSRHPSISVIGDRIPQVFRGSSLVTNHLNNPYGMNVNLTRPAESSPFQSSPASPNACPPVSVVLSPPSFSHHRPPLRLFEFGFGSAAHLETLASTGTVQASTRCNKGGLSIHMLTGRSGPDWMSKRDRFQTGHHTLPKRGLSTLSGPPGFGTCWDDEEAIKFTWKSINRRQCGKVAPAVSFRLWLIRYSVDPVTSGSCPVASPHLLLMDRIQKLSSRTVAPAFG